MVESTNQDDDRPVEPVDREEAETATIEKDGDSDASEADAEGLADDEHTIDEEGVLESGTDEEGASDKPIAGKPSFWKQYRLGIGFAVLAVLVVVAVSQVRWYMNWSAQIALERRDTKSAIWWIQTAKRILPNDHWKTEFLLARIFRRQNNIEQMEAHLRRAYELPGADILAIDREQTLAQAQNGQINAVGGDEMLRRLFLNHRGDAAEIANAFVHGYLRNRDYNRAQVLLNNWINGFGRLDPEAYLLRAKLYKELQRWNEAEKDLRQVLASNAKHYIAAWELGDVLRTRKQTDEALSYFELACSQDSPVKEEARVAKAHCRRRSDSKRYAQSDGVLLFRFQRG